jgi:hypothetical protein
MLQADPEPVRRAAASAQASVRQRAAALLKLLGAEDAAGAPCAPQSSSVGDLMRGMDEPTPAAATQASAQDLLGASLACPQLVTNLIVSHTMLVSKSGTPQGTAAYCIFQTNVSYLV